MRSNYRRASIIALAAGTWLGLAAHAAESPSPEPAPQQHTFIDVHQLGPGNVTAQAVAEAHEKDLQVQGRYGVSFEAYWVDETDGLVYCLATAPDAEAVAEAHREAHGLVPDEVHEVVAGN